ncbi:MAG: thioredoxin-disulfide reductase [Myxococcota bacterium]|nr:thioredoxin-disulfide reductase [Myxococcota bacterium]
MNQEVRRVVIIGGGPAGYTAAIYAARAGRKPLLIEGLAPGGQLMMTTDIENFPGFEKPLPGPTLMSAMRAQAERVGTEIIGDYVERVDLAARPFTLHLSGGELKTHCVIVATGAEAKWLNLPSEKEFQGRGVSACATCDGFFFRGKKVAVVGGGDTAAEEAGYLTSHASEVLLVHRRDELRASKIMADRVLANPKVRPLWHKVVDQILGNDEGVNGIRLKDVRTGECMDVELDGVFVAIGHAPNTALLGGQVKLDGQGYIATAPGSTRTSVEGVFAAGDVQDSKFRQAVTAAGTGCMAAIEAGHYLDEHNL